MNYLHICSEFSVPWFEHGQFLDHLNTTYIVHGFAKEARKGIVLDLRKLSCILDKMKRGLTGCVRVLWKISINVRTGSVLNKIYTYSSKHIYSKDHFVFMYKLVQPWIHRKQVHNYKALIDDISLYSGFNFDALISILNKASLVWGIIFKYDQHIVKQIVSVMSQTTIYYENIF